MLVSNDPVWSVTVDGTGSLVESRLPSTPTVVTDDGWVVSSVAAIVGVEVLGGARVTTAVVGSAAGVRVVVIVGLLVFVAAVVIVVALRVVVAIVVVVGLMHWSA